MNGPAVRRRRAVEVVLPAVRVAMLLLVVCSALVAGCGGSEPAASTGPTASIEGLSLADRLCLAAAERLDEAVLTADAAWGVDGRVRQIR